MEAGSQAALTTQPKRGIKQLLLSYFYWTYPRGSFHYDVMVTLILLFIFITPHLWNYGDKSSPVFGPSHALEIMGDGGRGLVVTLRDVDAAVPAGASQSQVKKALRKAIGPVTGDAVFVDNWQTFTDADGNLYWKVWVHR